MTCAVYEQIFTRWLRVNTVFKTSCPIFSNTARCSSNPIEFLKWYVLLKPYSMLGRHFKAKKYRVCPLSRWIRSAQGIVVHYFIVILPVTEDATILTSSNLNNWHQSREKTSITEELKSHLYLLITENPISFKILSLPNMALIHKSL